MSERLMLKDALQARKFRRMELSSTADAKLRSMKELLVKAVIYPLGEIDCDLILSLAAETKKLKDEYTLLTEEIAKIEKELE